MRHTFLLVLHLSLLTALPLQRTATTHITLPRVATPSLLFKLPRFCKSQSCIQKAMSLLRTTCEQLHHIHSLHTIRANCPSSNLQPLLSSPRFSSIQLAPSLNLLSHHFTKRAFLNVTKLFFYPHPSTAITPAGYTVPITAQPQTSKCSPTLGEGVRIYVIDTGCRTTHEQLLGRVSTQPAPGSRFRSGEDDHGHGTHVATTIAGRDFGLAPRAQVICIKALSDSNEGSGTDVMSGIKLAMRIHPRGQPGIISISLGVRAEKRYRALDQAIGRAARVGIISVVAAGNSGRDACTFTPARAASAVTVAAVGRDGILAEFSNWGRCVVVGAPGVGVWSAVAAGDRLYGVSSGTSMAAPFVSGLVALRLSEGGTANVDAIRAWLWEISRESMGLKVVSVEKFCRWMKRHR